MDLDVLFVHPGNHKKTYQDLSNEFTAIAPPVWTGLMANAIRNDGRKVAIYDINVEGWSEELFKRFNPRLVVMMVYGHNPSASTQTMAAAEFLAQDIKRMSPELKLAVGGLHPTILPEQTLQDTNADMVIKNEGLYAIRHLLEHLDDKRALQDVESIAYFEDGKMVETKASQLIQDLDKELPDYAWDLLPPLKKYRAHNSHTFQYFEESNEPDFSDVRSPYAVLYTSLGCPLSCSFCCINGLFGKPSIRYWSLDTVIGWIDTLVNEHGVKHIRLDDELFILDQKRVEAFCDAIIERGYDLNFWAYATVDTIYKPKLLEKLRKAGFQWICLGIESSNAEVRKDVDKKYHKDIPTVVRTLQEHNIYVLGNYMFGLPHENRETMQETFDLSKELNCEFSNYYCTMAYPGSKLYTDVAREHPKWLPENWNGFSQHSYDTKPLPTEHLKPEEVLEFRDNAFHEIFESKEYLDMVKEKFGQKAHDHIQRMISIRLKRKLLGDEK